MVDASVTVLVNIATGISDLFPGPKRYDSADQLPSVEQFSLFTEKKS